MATFDFNLVPLEDIRYYGKSDLLAQIADELRNHPDSCFSKNAIAWYNAEYSAGGIDVECGYQVQIDERLCPPPEENTPETLEDVIDIIGGFVSGNGRRVARASIRIICRQALRNSVERFAPTVP